MENDLVLGTIALPKLGLQFQINVASFTEQLFRIFTVTFERKTRQNNQNPQIPVCTRKPRFHCKERMSLHSYMRLLCTDQCNSIENMFEKKTPQLN